LTYCTAFFSRFCAKDWTLIFETAPSRDVFFSPTHELGQDVAKVPAFSCELVGVPNRALSIGRAVDHSCLLQPFQPFCQNICGDALGRIDQFSGRRSCGPETCRARRAMTIFRTIDIAAVSQLHPFFMLCRRCALPESAQKKRNDQHLTRNYFSHEAATLGCFSSADTRK